AGQIRARRVSSDEVRTSRPFVRDPRRAEERARGDIGWQLPARVAVCPYHLFVRNFEITFAISTAARGASVPRLISSSRQRARAWFSSSKLRTALITGTPWLMAIRWSASVTDRLILSA